MSSDGGKRGQKQRELDEDQEHWLVEFLERADVTCINPGKKVMSMWGRLTAFPNMFRNSISSGPFYTSLVSSMVMRSLV